MHFNLQAICVSPFQITCMSQDCGKKPTQTHREHESIWCKGDRVIHQAPTLHPRLTSAAVVKSKCIFPPAPCSCTAPRFPSAPLQCQTAAETYLSPARNPFVWWENTFLSFFTQGIYLHFKTSCSFHKISCIQAESISKNKAFMPQSSVKSIFF